MKECFGKIIKIMAQTIKIMAVVAILSFILVEALKWLDYFLDSAPNSKSLSQCVRMHIEVDDKNANVVCDEYVRK